MYIYMGAPNLRLRRRSRNTSLASSAPPSPTSNSVSYTLDPEFLSLNPEPS